MSDEPEQPDGRSTDSDRVLDDNKLRALVEESQSRERLVLEEKYGPDVRLLAADNKKLLSYLECDDPSRNRVALLCLLYFYTAYPERIIRAAADLIVGSDDIEIRSLCVQYLSQSRTAAVNSILKNCVVELETRETRPGDDVMRRFIASKLRLASGAPLPFAEVARMAVEIQARLRSARE
jgi:hypothetical protein